MNELALFAGAGGGILGGILLGWRTVCAVEIDPYCRKVLLARQRDGILPRFPIWDDIKTFDGKHWQGSIDVVSGGFPCQDISCAGKGAGIEGSRSGLWVEMARVIREVRPRFVFVENSPMLTSRGLGHVLGGLAEMGYDARWGVLGADDAGAPHRRKRIWIVGHTDSKGKSALPVNAEMAQLRGDSTDTDSNELRHKPGRRRGSSRANPHEPRDDGEKGHVAHAKGIYAQGQHSGQREEQSRGGCWWRVEPDVGRVANGVAHRVDRLKALGNGQVPAVAAFAWETLSKDFLDPHKEVG